MKTLYISDLDGTLLSSQQRLSEFTIQTINKLVDNGLLFSYATARSYLTVSKVTQGLNAKIPVISYNGSMIINNKDGSVMLDNFFGEDGHELLDDLLYHNIYPIVYSMEENQERMSFIEPKMTNGMREFLDTRKNDRRIRNVLTTEQLHEGSLFYITCIDQAEKLQPIYEKYCERYHCVFDIDLYTKAQWLEIMPKSASKSNAARQLKTYFGCDRLVVFGNGKNDIDLFELADEAYAVENAVPELKKVATSVIESNDNDGVAKWLLAHHT